MKNLFSLAADLLALAGVLPAQTCGTLTVTGGPTTPVVFTALEFVSE
jgi:hypothetical protein